MRDENRASDSSSDPDRARNEFYAALYDGLVPPGFSELRCFLDDESQTKSGLKDRHFFPSIDAMLAALDGIIADAAKNGWGVFHGVLPRIGSTSGTNKDVTLGWAVWADFDPKDYGGDIEEGRRRLARFSVAPTAVIDSGRGFHGYWLFKEPVGAAVIEKINTGLIAVFGSDKAVKDPARVLRTPGSRHMKNPRDPRQVRIEVWEPGRRYNPGDFDEVLPLEGEPVDSNGRTAPGERPAGIAERISDRILGLFDKYPKLHRLFEGTGKPAIGDDGKPMDTSSSGYDFSVLRGLAAKGVTDELELAAVLWHRKDDAARSKGMSYIRRTVKNAVATAAKRGKKTGKVFTPTFKIDRVRIFLTDPASYEFTVGGVVFTCSAEELLKPSKFTVVFMNATQQVVVLPKAPEWGEFLTGLLATADRVAVAPEATRDGAIRAVIERVLPDLGVGQTPKDLDRGKALEHDGVRIFKAEPVHKRVVQDLGPVEKPDFYRVLHELGYESDTFTIAGTSLRAWRPSLPKAQS